MSLYSSISVGTLLFLGAYFNRACGFVLGERLEAKMASCITDAVLTGLAIVIIALVVLGLVSYYGHSGRRTDI